MSLRRRNSLFKKRTRSITVMRIWLTGMIDELLILDGGTERSGTEGTVGMMWMFL